MDVVPFIKDKTKLDLWSTEFFTDITKGLKRSIQVEPIDKKINKALEQEVASYEVRKEDDRYFVGPFWIIGKSVDEINKGNFELLAPTKVLADWNGHYTSKVPKTEFLHKHLWNKYKSKYGNVEYNHFPRGIEDENIDAVSIAECGAMGPAGQVIVIGKNCEVFRSKTCREEGYIPAEEVLKNVPSLCGVQLSFFFAKAFADKLVNDKWHYFDLGFGKHLFLTSGFYEKYDFANHTLNGRADISYWRELVDKIEGDRG